MGLRVMPNLSIKNVPEEVLAELRARAKRNHRSLQGELLAILEDTVATPKTISVAELGRRVRELGIKTGDDSTAWIREDRDAR